MFDIKGKVAIITGSSRGIGKATAIQFGRSGAKVVVSSRKQEACELVADEIRAEGGEAIAVGAHVGHYDQVKNLVEKTKAKWGGIDILVCNAATNPIYGPGSETTDDVFEKMFTINVRSTMWITDLVLPQMVERDGGAVVLLSSIAASRGSDKIGLYGMTKAAEAQFARNLAVEWGPKNIRINAVAPGIVKTDFAQALVTDTGRIARMQETTPLRRFGEPEDIAGVIHFLVSPASAYITGQLLVVDGGETIC